MSNKEYKYYPIFEVFSSFERGKVHSQNTLPDGNSHFYVGAKKNFNGVMRSCGYDESLISKGNCVIFICNGEGSVGYCNYMDRDFMASGDLVLAYGDFLNPYIGLYLVTLLDLERPKYSFGRKYGSHVKSTKILLPTLNDKPDWQYMETFVKDTIIPQLPPKAQKVWLQKYDTTPMKKQNLQLNTGEWKCFVLDSLFSISRGKTLTSDDKEYYLGDIPCVNGTSINNGVLCFLSEEIETKGFKKQPIPSLSLCRVGTSGLTFVQTKPYYIADNAFCLLLKEQQNVYVYLFLSSILDKECVKYCYGRTISSEKYMQTRIKLPVTPEGTPDWQFMEDYIKSLPYSKNIEPSKPDEVVDELMEVKKEMIKLRHQLQSQQQANNINNFGTINIYEK